MAFNNAVNDSGYTPNQLLYGTDIALPMDLVAPRVNTGPNWELRDYVKELRHINALVRQGTFYEPDSRAVTSSNFPEQVWLQVPVRKSKLENPYEGLYRVLSSRPPNYVIDYKGTERTVHITQVKPLETQLRRLGR